MTLLPDATLSSEALRISQDLGCLLPLNLRHQPYPCSNLLCLE